MSTARAKRGETAKRIYALLKHRPDLTTNEIAACLPEVSTGMVQVTVSRMCQQGKLESRGRKQYRAPSGRMVPAKTYHVKYNSRPKPKKRKSPEKVLRVVEAPKVVDTQPVWQPTVVKPEPEGPTTPMAEREVLKGTLADLAETKDELDRERQRRNWWDRLKDLFS